MQPPFLQKIIGSLKHACQIGIKFQTFKTRFFKSSFKGVGGKERLVPIQL